MLFKLYLYHLSLPQHCCIFFVIIFLFLAQGHYCSSHTQTGTCTASRLWTVLSLLLPCGGSNQVFSYGKLCLDLCNENYLSTQTKNNYSPVHSQLSEPLWPGRCFESKNNTIGPLQPLGTSGNSIWMLHHKQTIWLKYTQPKEVEHNICWNGKFRKFKWWDTGQWTEQTNNCPPG